jgi:lipopolysaccharide/colanic/teichoic acid biosynthesis glycosyltransferase
MAILDSRFLTEEVFVARLHLEQRRTERSRRPFVFLLLESASLLRVDQKHGVCDRIAEVLSTSIRETDVRGWYKSGYAIGVIFTEIGAADGRITGKALIAKIGGLLASKLTADQIGQIDLSYYLFPEDWDKETGSARAVLYPDTPRSVRSSQLAKRCLDIAGSLTGLVLASPLLLVIAAAIRLTSKGPIFFRQERVGQYGRKFTFLKFRSMRVNNDHAIHREFVKSLIAGAADSQSAPAQQKVFKLTNDPRITAVGKFLRKTSLDELPQFLNVLLGQMSLVGPRPPIPYEVESYDIWHRRRLLEVKPGITGLWQVNGRSRTTFDEMVRLDLQYAKSWTVWLDVKILLKTPRAVVAGDGAY